MKKILIACLMVLAILTGCQKTATAVDTDLQIEKFKAFENPEIFMDVATLKGQIDKNTSMLLLDARGEAAYNKGHLPGALPVSWQQFSQMENLSPGQENFGVVLNPEDLSKALSAIGIDDNTPTIVYADTLNGWGEDARILWMLNMAGFNNVKLLDGGISQWTANNYGLSYDAPEITPSNVDLKAFQVGCTISTEDLYSHYSDYQIIDSRALDEYQGATKFGEKRGGHLPGAISLPFNDLLDENGILKSHQAIQKILNEKNIDKNKPVVTYCTAGIRSAHLALMLKEMGYEALNYDGSFYEWAGDETKELEK